jgi:hypothetical protein
VKFNRPRSIGREPDEVGVEDVVDAMEGVCKSDPSTTWRDALRRGDSPHSVA